MSLFSWHFAAYSRRSVYNSDICYMAPSSLSIILANCQGLRDINKQTDVLNYFADIKPDILCLKDRHWLSEDKKIIKILWAGECLLSSSQTNTRGVAILINKTFENKIISVQRDISGNLISASLSINEFSIKIINIYGPNKDYPGVSCLICFI